MSAHAAFAIDVTQTKENTMRQGFPHNPRSHLVIPVVKFRDNVADR